MNAQRGEVSFEADGKTWTLRYTTNSLCELEEHLDRGILDIAAELQGWGPPLGADGKPLDETADQAAIRARRMRLPLVRALFWAGLLDRSPNLTLAGAGQVMTEIGLQAAIVLVVEAFAKAFPDAGTKDARPRKPARGEAGIGLNS